MEGESLFRTVGNKSRLSERVVNEIQSLIVSGQLEAGVKLPPERELAEELGVSRTVVREAVRILVAKGLLETKPGVGTIVRQVTTDQVVEPLSLMLRAQGGSIPIEHLDQVRHILEVEIAGLAAMQATEEDVAELKRVMARLEAFRDDSEAFAAGDADFHRVLAQTAHNPLLIILLDSIRDLMQEVRILVARYPDLADRVMPDHYKILERVIAEDVEGARQAMAEHLEHARRIQEQALKESKNTPEKIGALTEGRYA